jgi:hypothetical protein
LLKDRALAVLDVLGHLDPTGPDTFSRLLGPLAPTGEYVSIIVRRTPTGEARYEQAWFSATTPDPRKVGPAWWGVLLCGVLVGVCITLGLRFVTQSNSSPQSRGEGGGKADSPPALSGSGPNGLGDKPPPANTQQVNNPITQELKKRVAGSQGVRSKLTKYLSQEDFAAKEVVEPKRSVKVISDLDFGRPKIESIQLSNVEVAELVELLKWLEVSASTTLGGQAKP